MFSIHPFSMNDYTEVIDLWRTTPGIGLSDADTPEAIAAYLERNSGMSFVARDGARLLGAVLCGTDGRRGYLHHLVVRPEARRQGIGEALVDICLSGLRQQGIHKCHLFVFAENTEGQAFWEHVSWKRRTDLVVMSKDTAA